MVPLSIFLYVELFAAGVLAFWVIARYPRLGPTSVRASLALLVVVLGLGYLAPAAIRFIARLPYGAYAVLLGTVLPVLFVILLAAGWFLRSLLSAAGGSGGGGHRISASLRGSKG